MKFFVVVTVAVALTVLFAGCVTMSIKVPVSRDRIAAALDISEVGINILYRLAENRGANVAEAREQSTAAFAFVRSLLVLEFRSFIVTGNPSAVVARPLLMSRVSARSLLSR